METLEKSIEILNHLIEINNDRVAGFTHAGKVLDEDDADLKAVFQELRDESRENVHELGTAINKSGGKVQMNMSGSGTFHRVWLDIKSTFTGHDRKSILSECERGEDAIKKAYQKALAHESDLSPELVKKISRQQQCIMAAHDQIKALRDNQV